MPDQLQPQPPPDAPAPLPSEHALRSRLKMQWILWVGASAVVLCFLFIFPLLTTSTPKSPRTEAMANAKQIGLALYNFDQDYGKYPDATTAAAVRLKSGSTLSLPDRTSNDLFAQLFAAGILDSERSFYAKCESSRKPDNVFHND